MTRFFKKGHKNQLTKYTSRKIDEHNNSFQTKPKNYSTGWTSRFKNRQIVPFLCDLICGEWGRFSTTSQIFRRDADAIQHEDFNRKDENKSHTNGTNKPSKQSNRLLLTTQ